jgi:hypothetical protein
MASLGRVRVRRDVPGDAGHVVDHLVHDWLDRAQGNQEQLRARKKMPVRWSAEYARLESALEREGVACEVSVDRAAERRRSEYRCRGVDAAVGYHDPIDADQLHTRGAAHERRADRCEHDEAEASHAGIMSRLRTLVLPTLG